MMFENDLQVLLVDDDPSIHFLVRNIFNKKGIKGVHTCSNGEEAIAFLQNNQVDVVIMDLMMPVMNGISLGKAIHHEYPVVMISAVFSDEYVNSLTDYHDSYVDKSRTGKDLFEATMKAIERWRPINQAA